MRLIDADKRMDELKAFVNSDIATKEDKETAGRIAIYVEAVARAHTVEAAPVRHGHWIEPESIIVSCICSACGFKFNKYEDDIFRYPYCANCGAKMDGEIEYDFSDGDI